MLLYRYLIGNEMPPEQSNTHTRPQGVFITLEAIYQTVTSIDDKIDAELNAVRSELAKMKAQLAAQWVVHGILVTTIIFLMQRGLTL